MHKEWPVHFSGQYADVVLYNQPLS